MILKNKHRAGSTLLIVILVMVLVMIFSVSALSVVSSQKPMTVSYSSQVDGIHFAEAGLNETLAKINKNEFNSIEFNKEIDFGRGKYILTLLEGKEDDGYVVVKATGYLKNNPSAKRTIESTIGKRTFTQHVWLTNSEGENIVTTTGHVFNGPFHTNGELNITGSPIFKGTVSCGTLNQPIGSTPVYEMGAPRKGVRYDFPTSNTQLKVRAIANGHYYNGMTMIYLKGDKYDLSSFDSTPGINKWKHEINKELPQNGIIYVDGNPNPNPKQWDRRTGDLYISGKLKGELTVASANNIYITGYNPTKFDVNNLEYTEGLTYYDNKKDILGLIANTNIEILSLGWPNPKDGAGSDSDNCIGKNVNYAINDIKLYGAFFALNGSFSYDYSLPGDKGTAELFGSLVQNTRAAWRSGTSGYGYKRNFVHDKKMEYKSPPYFLEPTNSGWEIKEWKEVNDHVSIP